MSMSVHYSDEEFAALSKDEQFAVILAERNEASVALAEVEAKLARKSETGQIRWSPTGKDVICIYGLAVRPFSFFPSQLRGLITLLPQIQEFMSVHAKRIAEVDRAHELAKEQARTAKQLASK